MLDEDEEGEKFEFDDSCDEAPEADRPPPAPPAWDYGATDHCGAAAAAAAPPSSVGTSPGNSLDSCNAEADLPPPPENCTTSNDPVYPTTGPLRGSAAPPIDEHSLDVSATAGDLSCDLPPPPEDATAPAAQTGRVKTQVPSLKLRSEVM